jgi:hypothetical protein
MYLFLDDELPDREHPLSGHGSHPLQRRQPRVRPLTWIVTAALIPVLIYDVWQTVQDVKHHHEIRAYALTANLSPPAAERPRTPFD